MKVCLRALVVPVFVLVCFFGLPGGLSAQGTISLNAKFLSQRDPLRLDLSQ